jgi:hypothetical protein
MDPDGAGEFLGELSFARLRAKLRISREGDHHRWLALELAAAAHRELQRRDHIINARLRLPGSLSLLPFAAAPCRVVLVVGTTAHLCGAGSILAILLL